MMFQIILNITAPEFDKLTAENFEARLKQVDLVSKTDFDKKLTSFNKQITSNETKNLKFQEQKQANKESKQKTNKFFLSWDLFYK